MICPHCGFDNVPGAEECAHCLMDLTQLDRPVAQDRIERSLMEDPVCILHFNKPITIPLSASVQETVGLMLARNIGALLVVDAQGRLVGVFSERDLLTRVAGLPESLSALMVDDFMTPNPETVTPTDTLAFALHKMDVGGYRHLPVVQEGKPIGVVSVRDMLRHITRLCKES